MIRKKHKNKTSNPDEDYDPTEDAAVFSAYFEYNKILRTWFVAFGIGGPSLLLVNEKVVNKLVAAGCLMNVVWLFLGGVLAQILGALLNKILNWYSYQDRAWAGVVLEHFWIDVLIDVITIICFGKATISMLYALK